MRKVVFIIILLFITVHSSAQDYFFTIQKNHKMVTSEGKDYIVVDIPEKTASELYLQALKGLSSIFNSPKDVISKIENQQIDVFGIITVGHVTFGLTMYALTNFTFKFKDNKVRIEAPIITRLNLEGSGNMDCFPQFKTNGGYNPKKKLYKSFHSAIQGIIDSAIKEEEDW